MSNQGKMLRGEKWYNLRDRDGKLPEGVSEDPVKMADVNYFLEKRTKKKGEK